MGRGSHVPGPQKYATKLPFRLFLEVSHHDFTFMIPYVSSFRLVRDDGPVLAAPSARACEAGHGRTRPSASEGDLLSTSRAT